MSYKQACSNTEKWNKALIKKGNNIIESDSDTEIIKDFGDGFKIVKLISVNAFEREGFLMRHCVSSYFGSNSEIYSLRDKNNMPHCTMEEDRQIKGKANGSISPKYVGYIVAFIQEMGMTVGDNEMENLGYMDVSSIKDNLHKDTNYFNEKYVYEDDELLGEDGKEFLSLDLLDIKPLVKETETSLKINFELPKLLSASFEHMKKSMGAAKNASSGDYARETVTGNKSVVAAIGRDSRIKAVLGTWITLAEYDDNNKVCFVKSGQVDNKNIKENTWYTLKGKEFTEFK